MISCKYEIIHSNESKPTALYYFANKKAQIFSPKCPQDTFGGASGGGSFRNDPNPLAAFKRDYF